MKNELKNNNDLFAVKIKRKRSKNSYVTNNFLLLGWKTNEIFFLTNGIKTLKKRNEKMKDYKNLKLDKKVW